MSNSKKKSKKKHTQRKVTQTKSNYVNAKREMSSWKDKLSLVLVASAIMLSFLAFSDSLNNEWVNWDDDKNFVENKLIQDISSENFWKLTGEIFTTDVIGGYNPLTVWTFALEKMAFGMEKESWKWWHLNNILLHLFCVFLIFQIGRQLGLNPIGAFLLALLFGIHPMRVESVAWLTERKDVLFASFYFAALFYYIKGKKLNKEFKFIWLIIPLFFLSGLSKIQAVSLPLTMIAVDYWLDKTFSLKSIIYKVPYFVISLVIGSFGFFVLSSEGVLLDATTFSFFQRLFIGSYSYIVYLGKFIYPWVMSPLYPYPSSFETIYYLSAIPFFALVGAIVFLWKKQQHVWVFGFLFFTVNVMFVLQILGAGQGFLADRFTYVPYAGLFFIAAYYFQQIDFTSIVGKAIVGIAGLYMMLFMYKTYQQVDVWSNSYSLWSHVIEYYPRTKVTWGNRANWLRDAGYKDLALADYAQRLSLGQDDPEPYNSRGKLYFQSQRKDTLLLALADYQQAVKLATEKAKTDGKYRDLLPEYLVNLGSTQARLNRNYPAIETFKKAEALDPSNPNVYFNRSITYHNVGDYENEQKDVLSYLKFRPYNGAMISNLATTKRILGDYKGAEIDYNRALRYSQIPAIYIERARNYVALGKFQEARKDAQLVIDNGIALPADLRKNLGM